MSSRAARKRPAIAPADEEPGSSRLAIVPADGDDAPTIDAADAGAWMAGGGHYPSSRFDAPAWAQAEADAVFHRASASTAAAVHSAGPSTGQRRSTRGIVAATAQKISSAVRSLVKGNSGVDYGERKHPRANTDRHGAPTISGPSTQKAQAIHAALPAGAAGTLRAMLLAISALAIEYPYVEDAMKALRPNSRSSSNIVEGGASRKRMVAAVQRATKTVANYRKAVAAGRVGTEQKQQAEENLAAAKLTRSIKEVLSSCDDLDATIADAAALHKGAAHAATEGEATPPTRTRMRPACAGRPLLRSYLLLPTTYPPFLASC